MHRPPASFSILLVTLAGLIGCSKPAPSDVLPNPGFQTLWFVNERDQPARVSVVFDRQPARTFIIPVKSSLLLSAALPPAVGPFAYQLYNQGVKEGGGAGIYGVNFFITPQSPPGGYAISHGPPHNSANFNPGPQWLVDHRGTQETVSRWRTVTVDLLDVWTP